jgi:hypothetical protein
MKLANTQLVRHGIQTELADLRFHVSVVTKSVYVFEPRNAIEAYQTGNYREAGAFTGAIQTAKGYLIPPGDIKGCRRVPIPETLFISTLFSINDSPSIKGKKAERVVNEMIRTGLISLVTDTVSIPDKEMQIGGSDILAVMAKEVQVKCDWRAGEREFGGSGNLYIQTEECNPLHQF